MGMRTGGGIAALDCQLPSADSPLGVEKGKRGHTDEEHWIYPQEKVPVHSRREMTTSPTSDCRIYKIMTKAYQFSCPSIGDK